jgi:hypothetical protein
VADKRLALSEIHCQMSSWGVFLDSQCKNRILSFSNEEIASMLDGLCDAPCDHDTDVSSE